MSLVIVTLCASYVQTSYYSYALKSLITISTIILLALITAYHSVQAQVKPFAVCIHSKAAKAYVFGIFLFVFYLGFKV